MIEAHPDTQRNITIRRRRARMGHLHVLDIRRFEWKLPFVNCCRTPFLYLLPSALRRIFKRKLTMLKTNAATKACQKPVTWNPLTRWAAM